MVLVVKRVKVSAIMMVMVAVIKMAIMKRGMVIIAIINN